MKYYKDTNGNVFAYELDGSQDYLIDKKVEMTAAEVEAHINPKLSGAELLAQWRNTCTVRASAIRLALLDQDLLDDVENAIKSAPRAMQVKWEFEVSIKRLDTDLVSFAKTQLNMADNEIDDIFRLAETK